MYPQKNSLKNSLKTIFSWIPVVFVVFMQFNYFNLYIPELNLFLLWPFFDILLFVFYITFELVMPRLNKYCGDISHTIYFHLFPVEFSMLFVFAQYHFKITLILVCVSALLPVLYYISVIQTVKRRDISLMYKTYKGAMVKFSVKAFDIVLLPVLIMGMYYLISRTPLVSPSVGAENVYVDYMDKSAEFFDEKTISKISALNSEGWPELSRAEKIDVLQNLINIETAYLRINPVGVVSNKLDTALAQYNHIKNVIYIDYDFLENTFPEECIEAVCHEVRHAYQHFCVYDMNLDWENDALLQTAHYYRHVRKWKYEIENYISGTVDYLKYHEQSIEKDARDYAESTCRFYMDHIADYIEP